MRRQVATPTHKAQAVRWQRQPRHIRCCRHHDGPLIGSYAWLWFIAGMIALVGCVCWIAG